MLSSAGPLGPSDPLGLRLWIDTDIGMNPDDAIALLAADAHVDVDVVGVSVTAGDTTVARCLLPRVTVVDEGAFEARDLPAVDALLALGPLTTVARLLDGGARPEVVAVMGGCRRVVRHRGVDRRVDANFGADPAAAAAIVARAPGLVLAPLDVTAGVVVDDVTRDRMAPAHPELARQLAAWPEPLVLHDPVALLAMVGEPSVRVESRTVRVQRNGALVEAADGRTVDVVVAVDRVAAIGRIASLLDR